MFQFARVSVQGTVVTLAAVVLLGGGCAAGGGGNSVSGGPIPAEVRLIERDPCDTQNKRLYVENQHESRTFAVTVRWGAKGGKELREQVFVPPHQMLELGCAAYAKILEATPTDFWQPLWRCSRATRS